MFLTLTPLRWEEPVQLLPRLRQRLCDRIRPPSSEARRMELLDSFFIHIQAPANGGAFDAGWQGTGRQSCRLALCPGGYTLPPGCLYAVSREDCLRLAARIQCNTLLRVLETSGIPLYSRRVGFIDTECAYPFLLELLIQYTPDILVYTKNHALYQGYADKLLDEYGAPVSFTEDFSSLRQTVLILHTGTEDVTALYPVPILCLLHPEGGGMLVEQPVFCLQEADCALPPGIDPLEFYTALYERCRIRSIALLSATSASCGSRNVTPRDIAGQIEQDFKSSRASVYAVRRI